MNSFFDNSDKIVSDIFSQVKNAEQLLTKSADVVIEHPMKSQVQQLLNEAKEQNKTLLNQVDLLSKQVLLLQEEKDRSSQEAVEAKKEAKTAKIIAIVSIVVSILIAVCQSLAEFFLI